MLQPVNYEYTVKSEDFAAFNGEVIHEVLSTYALTREAEWVGRLILLQIKQENEQGIGSFVEVAHHAPAFLGETITFEGTPLPWKPGEEMVVEFEAKVGNRTIAKGRTGQRLLPIDKLKRLIEKARHIK